MTPAEMAHSAAEWMMQALLAQPGPVAVALSGGSTPGLLYEVLAAEPFRGMMPWDRIHWFWGDERFVPPDDERSNYHMAYSAMLGHVPVPARNMHPVQTEDVSPEETAGLYQQMLQAYYGAATLDPAKPLFDVVLLGLGANGHTASLFPDMAVLDNRTDWAAAVTPKNEQTRITLTYPALESCRHAAFLVAGADKRDVLARVRAGDAALPAARYKPQGELVWFVDAAAS